MNHDDIDDIDDMSMIFHPDGVRQLKQGCKSPKLDLIGSNEHVISSSKHLKNRIILIMWQTQCHNINLGHCTSLYKRKGCPLYSELYMGDESPFLWVLFSPSR
jgi:hypothetical protein